MANLIDYIEWRGDITFEMKELNEIDAAVFSQVVYAPFEKVLQDGVVYTFADAAELLEGTDPAELEGGPFARQAGIETLRALRSTERFGALRIAAFILDTSIDEESQFCAMAVEISPDTVVIVYRGTDGTIVGWHENFNMGFMKATTGQRKAVEFINKAVKPCYSTVYVAGHSKGGNLAMYASVFSDASVRDRIKAVYNNDGPGFLDEVIESAEYKAMVPRIRTFIPESSMIGIILEHREKVYVVGSTASGFDQHSPMTWKLKGIHFEELPSTDAKSQFVDKLIRSWLVGMNQEQLKTFSETLFRTLENENIETLEELWKLKPNQWMDIAKKESAASKEQQSILGTAVHVLLSEGGRQLKESILPEKQDKSDKNE